ncbi:MAG: hypothetical protein ACTHJZ_04315, partial [Trinickia sp.]
SFTLWSFRIRQPSLDPTTTTTKASTPPFVFRIWRTLAPKLAAAGSRRRIFRLTVKRPFENAGDARRASIAYAEQLIDACDPDKTVWDSE